MRKGKREKRVCVIAMIMYVTVLSAVYGSEGIVIMRMRYGMERDAGVQSGDVRNISQDIGRYLRPHYRVFVDATLGGNRDSGITRADAEKALGNYPANFVLYGAVTNEGNYLQGRFELYDKRNDRVELFYASDGMGEYDRLIRNVSGNILTWFQTKGEKIDEVMSEVMELREELRGEVWELKEKVTEIEREGEEQERLRERERSVPVEREVFEREEPEKEITLKLPVRVGYWTYTEKGWLERIQGTVEANVGVMFIPELQFPSIKGWRNELSIDIYAGYRYGLNAGADFARVHSIIINSGLTYHFNIYHNNWLEIGAGVLFEYGIWQVEEKEYEEVTEYRQSMSGLSIMVGYSYRVAERVTIDMGANVYVYFAEGASAVLRPYMGTSIIIVGGKNSAIR